MATLQQLARLTEVVVDADRAAVEADGVGEQAVDAEPLLREIAIKGGLSSGSTKHGQHVRKPVIGAVGRAQVAAEQGLDGMGALSYPVADDDQLMGAFAQNMGQPDGDEGTRAGTLPMPMGMDLSIDHSTNTQILHQPQQKWDAVDLFINDSHGIGLHKRIVSHQHPNFASHLRE